MMRLVPVLATVLASAGALAACTGSGEEQQQPPAQESAATASATAVAAESPVPQPTETGLASREASGARAVAEETDDYLFEYKYPAAAGSIAALGSLLDERLEEQRAELARSSADARRQARSDGFPYNKHSYEAEWKIVADLPDWLSLSNEFSTYSGGAHGIYGVTSLVWDKEGGEAMEALDLFTSPQALADALGDRFCDELNTLREQRRGEPVDPSSDDPFNACPDLDETVVLVGSAGGRRFDRLTLYVGPYVAGPYVEGDWRVNLNVDRQVLEAVKPAYRASFATRNRA